MKSSLFRTDSYYLSSNQTPHCPTTKFVLACGTVLKIGGRVGYNAASSMKRPRPRKIPLSIRSSVAILWSVVCAAFLAAPLLEATGHKWAAALLYALFSPVCHQSPSRSFAFFGHSWAVCHRCSGIYSGLLLGSLVPFGWNSILQSPRLRRLWVICGTAPLLIDVMLQWSGIRTNTAVSRSLTGLLFGAMLSSLVLPALAEFREDARRRHPRMGSIGGTS
jgi:uncharacterized membrane protein